MEHKGYSLVKDGTFGLIKIKMIGKGSVPKTLKGSYTTYRQATDAIDAYKPTEGPKDGDDATS